jgi:hypothetical protein
MRSNTAIIERMPGEVTDLALHVNLCEQRYIQLIDKFDRVDQRLDAIEGVLVDIKTTIAADKKDNTEKYLKWAGTIIVVLSSALVGVVTHLLFK